MTCIANQPDGPQLRSYVLAGLRCAALRARLAAADIDVIGIALNAGWIGSHEAIEALADAGALDYLDEPPSTTVAAP